MERNTNRDQGDRNLNIALAGILSAVAFLFCFIAGISPVLGISLLAIASFVMGVIVVEADTKYAMLCYLVTGILVLFFVPQKFIAIPAFLFFLPYPIVKKFVEKDAYLLTNVTGFSKTIMNWVYKILFFIFGLGLSCFLSFRFLGMDYIGNALVRLEKFNISVSQELLYCLICIVVLVVFVIYDILFSQLGRLYLFKYSRCLRRNK